MYDFSTLNDKDFEEIVCDLLSEEHGIIYQSFKEGKDQGIDLGYSSKENENHTVVQVKHFLKSGKTALKSKLKIDEFRKAERLEVEKYIVVTSIGLSPEDKGQIKEFFQPYIQTTNDIYGQEELCTLLGKHDHVEKKHFKLWFTNTKVLENIINNGIKGRSTFVANKIKQNIGLFVKTQSFDFSLEILQNEKVLLISGIPGIGKTTLSYMIIYKLLGSGYELIYCDNDISEVEDVFEVNKKKQIFFFDDFLGDTYLEVKQGKNKKINDFINRVRASSNKLVILTSRTTILSQARYHHEKLRRTDFDSNNFELKLDNYDDYHKAEIFYNHLYFSNLKPKDIEELLREKRYTKIIYHKNYNPRLLEFITDPKKYEKSEFSSYHKFCVSNLDNPEEIWSQPIRNQLNHSERYLLYVLLSLGGSYNKNKLEKAYEETKRKEVETQNFNDVYQNLLKGYVKAFKYDDDTTVQFINPSLKDYLLIYFNQQKYERKDLFSRFKFIEQLENYTVYSHSLKYSYSDWFEVVKNVLSDKIHNLFPLDDSQFSYKICLFLSLKFTYLKDLKFVDEIDVFICKKFQDINWTQIANIYPHEIENFFDNNDSFSRLKHFDFIYDNFHLFLEKIIEEINDITHLDDLNKLEYLYDYIDISKTLLDHNLIEKYEEALVRVYDYEAEQLYYDKNKSIENEDDLELANQSINELKEKIGEYSLDYENLDLDFNPFSEQSLEEIINSNSDQRESLINRDNSDISEKKYEIDELFQRFKM